MKFPFDESSVQELIGKPMVLSGNALCSNEYRVVKDIVLLPDGQVADDSGKWEVEDGVLRLLNDKGYLVTEFRGLETRNGAVYAVGTNVLETSLGTSRLILHVKKPLNAEFGICISSHTSYEKVAVPRILRSLEGDGFDMNRVVVVIGNDAKNDGKVGFEPELKVNVVRRRNVMFGLTSMGNIPGAFMDNSYWLLLHDTCEVTNGFTKNIMALDIGLNPDIVMLRPMSEKVELGLYAKRFASKMSNISHDTKPYEYFTRITLRANIISVLNSSVKTEPEKDVYGRGIKRETITFQSVGIKKYRAKALNVNKP